MTKDNDWVNNQKFEYCLNNFLFPYCNKKNNKY